MALLALDETETEHAHTDRYTVRGPRITRAGNAVTWVPPAAAMKTTGRGAARADTAQPGETAAVASGAVTVDDHRPPNRLIAGVARLLTFVWSDRRLQVLFALAVPTLAAIVIGWWTPRGPMTSDEALASMVIGLVVGATVGLATRSRWAILIAPLVFAVGFELMRMGTDSMTVDALHPASLYGLIGLVTVRGFHGLVGLTPMSLAAAFGAAFTRRMAGTVAPSDTLSRISQVLRRGVAVVATVGLVAISFGLAQSPSTATIRSADGTTELGSVAELTKVNIGGHPLSMMIRGTSADNPILLYLAGGPGGTDIGAMRNHLAALEQHFLVVTWDQRGTGTSYDQIDPISTLTFDNAVSDTLEVTNYLRHRFGRDTAKVYLVGNSYGTLLGVRAVQQHPELYAAFVGTGQMVSPRETDRIIYTDTLAWARRTGNSDMTEKLRAIGPPPYTRILDYETTLAHMDDVYPYDHTPNDEGAGGFSENLLGDEYSLVDEAHNLAGFLDTFSIIYPQLQELDFRVDATRLDVPVYIAEGRYEVRGRSELAHEWFAQLRAPHKELVTFETSGHRPLFEQPGAFVLFMTDTVLAQTRRTPS